MIFFAENNSKERRVVNPRCFTLTVRARMCAHCSLLPLHNQVDLNVCRETRVDARQIEFLEKA